MLFIESIQTIVLLAVFILLWFSAYFHSFGMTGSVAGLRIQRRGSRYFPDWDDRFIITGSTIFTVYRSRKDAL